MLHHFIHWFLDFIGVNNTYDRFSTKMYNFWSGFGGNISILALLATVFSISRKHAKRIEQSVNPLHLVQQVQQEVQQVEQQIQHKKDGTDHTSSGNKKP